jgi:hypothetical protein
MNRSQATRSLTLRGAVPMMIVVLHLEACDKVSPLPRHPDSNACLFSVSPFDNPGIARAPERGRGAVIRPEMVHRIEARFWNPHARVRRWNQFPDGLVLLRRNAAHAAFTGLFCIRRV